jgi:hypothetical protein
MMIIFFASFIQACGAGVIARPFSSTATTDAAGYNYYAPANACPAVATVFDYAPVATGNGNFRCKEYNPNDKGYYIADINCRFDVCSLITPRFYSKF